MPQTGAREEVRPFWLRMPPCPPAIIVVLAVLVVFTSGCGTETGGERSQTEPPSQGSVPTDVLADAPLDQALGSPFAADDEGLWYSDFSKVAHYQVASGRWTTTELPFADDTVVGLAFDTDGTGALYALALLCTGACGEDAVPTELRAWHSTPEGDISASPQRIRGFDETSFAIPMESARGSVTFRFSSGVQTWFLTVDSDGVDVTKVDHAYSLVCPLEAGYVAVENDTTGRAAARRQIVAGTSLSDLRMSSVPDDVATLLEETAASTTCIRDGLAIVGPTVAWESVGETGEWTRVASDVRVSAMHQLVIDAPVFDTEGRTWVATSHVDLMRDDRGWHAVNQEREQGPTQFGLSTGTLIAYPDLAHRPTASLPTLPSTPRPQQKTTEK